MKFKISGFYQKGKKQTFSTEIEAVSENFARHLVLSTFGGKHNLPRNKITIEKVEKVK